MTIKKWTYAVGFTAGLALVACSGENGTDGAPGADGADGTSCVAEALEDGSGFDMICGGKSVGTVKNGEDGANGKDGTNGKNGADGKNGTNGTNGTDGKDGTSCVVKPFDGGFKVLCAGDSVGVLVNGVDGTNGSNGTNGKSAYELAVEAGFEGTEAQWLAALKGDKGDAGDDGVSCVLTDNNDGTVTVTCGASSTTLFKAVCGTTAYDPAEQFCVGGKTYALCEGKTKDYDPTTHACGENDIVVPLCGGKPYYDDQKCEEGVILTLCGDKDDPKWHWYYDSTKAQCLHSKTLGDRDLVFDHIPVGDGFERQSDVDSMLYVYVSSTEVQKRAYCGSAKYVLSGAPGYHGLRSTFTPASSAVVYSFVNDADSLFTFSNLSGHLYNPETHFCDIPEGSNRLYGTIVEKCDGEVFNTATHFCDYRENKLYSFKKIGTQIWMTQNLAYADSVATPNLKGLWSCPGSAGAENLQNCEEYGMLYKWSAAMDIDGTYQSTLNNPTEPRQGICPDGWHLPSYDELSALNEHANYFASITGVSAQEALMDESWSGVSNNLGFNAVIPSTGSGYTMWGSTENAAARAASLMINATNGVTLNESFGKGSPLYVRCVRN